MSGDNISFGNINRSVIGGKITGTGNIVGENVVVNNQKIEQLHPLLGESLKSFSESVENLIKVYAVPETEAREINRQIEDLAVEIKDVNPDEELPYAKKSILKAKIAGIADSMFRVLPSAVETAASFTPLAPFSKVIGESVEGIVKAVRG